MRVRWGNTPVTPVAPIEQVDNNLLVETAWWIAFRAVGWLHENGLAQLVRIDSFLDRRLALKDVEP